METKMIRLLSKDKQVRIFMIDNTSLVSNLIEQQKINKVCQETLAKTFTISNLLCGLLEGNQRLSIQMVCSNSSESIRCEVDSSGNVNGYCSKALLESKPDTIAELIGGRGYIRITKGSETGSMYTGCVDMPYQNITEDFSNYFRKSEQLYTAFQCYYDCDKSQKVVRSRGFLIQLMPFAPEEHLTKWTGWIDEHKMMIEQLPLEQLIPKVFKAADIMAIQPIRLFCGCSREMFYGMINSLGEKELSDIISKKQTVEMNCGICGKSYSFPYNEVAGLIMGG